MYRNSIDPNATVVLVLAALVLLSGCSDEPTEPEGISFPSQ